MNKIYFDSAIRTFSEYPGYRGNPPQSETEYANIDWYGDWVSPTWAEVQSAITIEKQKDCKDEAKKRIATTDWAVLPDVGLANVAAFETYRAALRELIKNPVAEPTWPTEPEPIWS